MNKCSDMIKQIRAYGVKDKHIIKAMTNVRRHLYIPEEYRDKINPYGNHPCPIGFDQTISQPYIVAYMTECISPKKCENILEIGTGSGYQAAVLSEMGVNVYSIEIIPALAEHAGIVLKKEGYDAVHLLTGDGYSGWTEYAPFDAIIVTCAPENIPESLINQLKEGGRMILPLGSESQRLIILIKNNGKIIQKEDIMVRFVPMVRET